MTPGRKSSYELDSTGNREAPDFFGCSVSPAGDINGDGWSDMVVGAKGYQGPGGGAGAGRAYVFYGGSTLSSKGAGSADAILTGEGPANPTGFGTFVSGVGDINGDGRSDIAVSDAGYNGNTGRCYLFFGGPTLLSRGAASADVILTGETGPGYFGTLGAASGDVNGDGYLDLIVGAPFANSSAGRAYVFYGGPALASKSAAGADVILNGENAGSQFGASVCWAGDVRQDGFADILAGSSGYNGSRGRAYLYDVNRYQILSPAGGQTWTVGTTQNVSWLGAAPADLWISENGGDSYDLLKSGVGGAASNAIAVTLPQASTRLARVKVTPADATISGSAESDSPFTIAAAAAPVADRLRWTVTGASANDELGEHAVTLGDINGDGCPDFIITAPGANAGDGAAYIFYGGPAPHASPDVILTGETGSASAFGSSAASAGDVNGDGYPDVIVSAPSYSQYEGAVYIFYGGPTLVSKPATSADVIILGQDLYSEFGRSVSGAGDLNGDGRPDILVGAPGEHSSTGMSFIFYGGPTLVSKGAQSADVFLTGQAANDQFGYSLSIVPDMNRDGVSDALISAPYQNSYTGRAYLFYGGPTLVSKGAGSADVILSGAGAGDYFGYPCAAVGDINGDTWPDIALGAPGYSSNTGRCYVFFGGPTLLSKGAAAADVIMTGETAGGYFGFVSPVPGDINGDGYPDLIVGLPSVYVFYGGPTLTSRSAASADLILSPETTGGHFGFSVSWAGDLRADGFADLLVGDYGYSGSRGRAYLYDMSRYQILSPAGGDTWNVGANQNISWLGAAPADVWLSEDGGDSYELLKSGVGGAASNVITMRVPHVPTKFARVKLTPADATISGVSVSDSLFTIQSSVSLLTFMGQEGTDGGAVLSWNTNPGVGPQGISGYRLYRSNPGSGETRIGPDPITVTTYTDPAGAPGSVYRLTAINGLGEELDLGQVSLGAVRALAAWPLPYRGGNLHVSFTLFGARGATGGTAEVGLYDLSGRLIRTLAHGSFAGAQPEVTWNGLDERGVRVPRGVYFLRASSGGQVSHLKLAVVQ